MLIGALSIFLAFNLTCLFTVLLLVTAKITHVPGLYLYPPTSAIVLTIIIFLGLFILVSSFTPMLIRTRKAVRLLKEGKQQKKEKHPCSSLFGAICLICGYALAANPLYFMSLGDIIGLLYAVSSIFVIPSLIAAGTYFFFSQISFYLFVF